MPIVNILEYGNPVFEYPDAKVTRSVQDLDSLVTTWQTDKRDSFAPGGNPPNYPNMTIMRIETTQEVDSPPRFTHRLECLGVTGPIAQKKISLTKRENLEGWDEGSAVYLTKTPSTFTRGESMEGQSNMKAISIDKEEYRQGWWWVTLSYRGLIGTKTYKRRTSTNEDIISPANAFANHLPGGWGSTPKKGQISLPRVSVQDSFVSLSVPPTSSIPGFSVPPDTPAVNSGITFFDMELVNRWPYGWKLAAIEGDNIPGTTIYFMTLTREYVYPAVPA